MLIKVIFAYVFLKIIEEGIEGKAETCVKDGKIK